MAEQSTSRPPSHEAPPFRYRAELAGRIEADWQDRWEADGTYFVPNPVGALSDGFRDVADRPKLYVLDMFPYPSGAGLHVGHPLGYIATDVFARFKRMTGFNVMHAMGYDAFGLPAEQYAVETGQHPRVTTEANITTMRRQLRALGLGHDSRRSVATTDVDFVRWTQWIFLQIFDAWFDPDAQRARPIAELVAELEAGTRAPVGEANPDGRPWTELTGEQRRRVVDAHRLAFRHEAPVNWCPALGTVLANEEVTADGRSERGNHPVYKRPLEQWMMRITAYADRLLADLDTLDWPEPVKLMQRNWIGRSEGARVRFPVATDPASGAIDVFTTRPDTLFGASYMVLAPEHPLVDDLVPAAWPEGTPEAWRHGATTPVEAIASYRRVTSSRSELERQADTREKSGVFTGAYATNPTTGGDVPVFVAEYVLMGYGTGAIMAVPAHDQRDFEFAARFGLPVPAVVRPPRGWLEARGIGEEAPAVDWPEAYAGEGTAVSSSSGDLSLDGRPTAEAKRVMIEWLEATGAGARTVTYKLRDWLFSRQRYWGEPFPIVYDDAGLPLALPEELLPVELPEVDDYAPRVMPDDDLSLPEPPLGRATDWTTVVLDLGDGPRTYRRELNTMPQWAGSCWYYLRYLDPHNDTALCDPEVEVYWMQGRTGGAPAAGGVDLYVGGVEHAVLHLLYSRFWHKVLHDLGHVSTPEPFQRLYNQGYILAPAFIDERGMYAPADEVVEHAGAYSWQGNPVRRESGKMGKSLKNSVTPEEMVAAYGTDTLRLYEMYMGPLDVDRPWSPQDIVGSYRFLQRVWRNVIDEETGRATAGDRPVDDETLRLLHRTIAAVTVDMQAMRFNTALAKLFELNNHLTRLVGDDGSAPMVVVEPLVLMLAPFAPHMAEELWARVGHASSLVHEQFPEADPTLLVVDEVDIPVQVNGKVRAHLRVATDAGADEVERAAMTHDRIVATLGDAPVRRVVVVPGRLVNIVTG